MTRGATPQSFNRSYDCVVIGAGNGGLAAAAQLAAKGVRVVLLEQHNVPGGFATSFVRGRFEFEAALHAFADVGPPAAKGTVRKFLEDDLGIYLDWIAVPEAFRLIVTDPDESMDVTLHYDAQEYINTCEREAPGSRESVSNYIELCNEVLDAIFYLGASKGNPDKKVLTSKYSNFLKTCPYTADQVAKALKVPKRAQAILHALWTYLGPPTSRLNFTVYAAMLAIFLKSGGYVPRQRSHEFAAALDSRISELGGDTEYNTKVEQILVRDGQVVGVTTSQGDRIATRHVICNASPTLAYNHLIAPRDAVPKLGYRECNARTHGVAGYVVYMGLDATLEQLGLNEYSYMIYAKMDTDEMYESCKTLSAPKIQAAACLNNAVPDCSPPGTSIVSITTLYQPDVWSGVAPETYVKTKNQIAADLIAEFERATGAPISQHIEEIEVATPVTFARYTGAHGGTIYGYEPEPWDSLIPRMLSMRDVPIQGLNFCGGSAFRCHGYSSSFKSGQTMALLTYASLLEEGEVAR